MLVDRHVTELARSALVAAINRAIQHQTGTDPLPDSKVDGVLPTPRRAQPGLSQSGQIRLVVNENGAHDPAMHEVGDGDAIPTPHEARARDFARRNVDRGRHSDANREDLIHGRIDRLEHVGDQTRRLVELVVCAVILRQRHVVLSHNGVGDIGERDPHVPGRNVHTRDDTESARKRHMLRATTAASRHRDVQNSGTRELFHDVRHGRGRQTCRPRKFDLRQATVPLDRVDDSGAVGFTK